MHIGNTSNSSDFSGRSGDTEDLIRIIQAACGILFAVGIPINVVIFYLVCRLRTLRKPTYSFIASLVIADSLVLVNMVIYTWSLNASWANTGSTARYLFPSLDMFLGAASMLNVACISIDRAVAVAYPLRYDELVTRKVSIISISAVWIYCFVVLILSLLRICITSELYHTIILYLAFALSYFVPITLILVSYTVILLYAVRNLKFTEHWERALLNARQFNVPTSNRQHSERRRHKRRKLFRELRVTGNLLIIVVPFTLGWTYFIGTQLYEEFNELITHVSHNVLMILIPWLLSGLNPILYFLLTRSVRQGCIEHFRNFRKDRSYAPDDSRTSLFASLSRRASNALLRLPSASADNTRRPSSSSDYLRRPSLSTDGSDRRRSDNSAQFGPLLTVPESDLENRDAGELQFTTAL